MESKQGRLVPLNQVHDVPLEDLERLSVDISLPMNVGAERVGVDVKSVESACRTAGIRELAVSTFDPEAPMFGIGGGVDKDGAMSMVRTISAAPTLGADSFLNRIRDVKSIRSVSTQIQLNVAELLRMVAEKSETGIRDVQSVADSLDFQLRKHLFLSGAKFLLSDVRDRDMQLLLLRMATLMSVMAVAGRGVMDGAFSGMEMGITVSVAELIVSIGCNAIAVLAGRLSGEKARISLFNGYIAELDRVVILAVKLGTRRLIDVVQCDE